MFDYKERNKEKSVNMPKVMYCNHMFGVCNS